MNIPDKVSIGYKTFKVNKVSGNVIDGSKVCYGNIAYDCGEINISTAHSEDQQKCTFIHECLHGIDDVMEIDLSEEQTRKLAKGLYSMIKYNHHMFKEEETR